MFSSSIQNTICVARGMLVMVIAHCFLNLLMLSLMRILL